MNVEPKYNLEDLKIWDGYVQAAMVVKFNGRGEYGHLHLIKLSTELADELMEERKKRLKPKQNDGYIPL